MANGTSMERYVGAALLLALAAGCVVVLRPFVSAALWAVVLSFSTWPIYSALERLFHGRRSLAATVMIAFAAAIFLVPLIALGSRLTSEATLVAVLMVGWMEHGPPQPPDWVATIPLVGAWLSNYWQGVASDAAKLTADLETYVPLIKDWVLSFGVKLTTGITDLILSLLIAFFLYRDGRAILEALRVALARAGGDRTHHLIAVAGETIKGVVYGVLGANLIQGLLAAAGLRIAGVPGALLLGFALFFLTLIPLAAALVFVPAILWLVHQGATISAIFLTVWYVIVFVIMDSALRAYFISRGGSLPLILVLLGMLGGIFAFGFLGIFVGPTLLAVAYALVQEWTIDRAPPAGSVEPAAVRARQNLVE